MAEAIAAPQTSEQAGSADLSRDYVAGRSWLARPQTLAAESWDGSLPCVTFEQYERMMRDPAVGSSVRLIVESVMADGVQITPAQTDDESREPLAAEIAAFCKYAIDSLPETIKDTGASLLQEAITHGYKLAEQTFQVFESGPFKGKAGLKSIRLLNYGDSNFVVDRFWNLVGFQAGYGDRQILPPAKFVAFTPFKTSQDPRGDVWIRPAFDAWDFKLASRGFHRKYLDHFAVPSLHGQPSEKSKAEVARDASGAVITDAATGQAKVLTPSEAMLAALVNFESAKALVTAPGSTVTPLEVNSEGEVFDAANRMSNSEIALAILLATRATQEAEHGSKADSQTASQIVDLLVWSLKNKLAVCLQRQVLRVLTLINYGPDALDLVPTVSLGDSERKDWAVDATAASKLASHITDSQWDSITTQLGIPAPLEDEERPKRGAIAKPENNKNPDSDTNSGGDTEE